jgi:hypothetical protein
MLKGSKRWLASDATAGGFAIAAVSGVDILKRRRSMSARRGSESAQFISQLEKKNQIFRTESNFCFVEQARKFKKSTAAGFPKHKVERRLAVPRIIYIYRLRVPSSYHLRLPSNTALPASMVPNRYSPEAAGGSSCACATWGQPTPGEA